MKKIMSLLLAIVLSCATCACGRKTDNDKNKTGNVTKEDGICVYSLTLSQQDIHQDVIDGFERMYPGNKIYWETGVSEEDGITIQDAIRNLNADMMAGNGPDVLFLDGLPIHDYIDKGLLSDMSGILEELRNDKQTFYENVLTAYAKDGKICAVPSFFAVPVVIGDEEVVQPETIHGLAKLIRERANDPIPVLGGQWVTQLPNIFMTTWKDVFPEHQKVDKEALCELLKDMKQMAEDAGFDKDLPYCPLFEVDPTYVDQGGWIPYLAWEKEQMLTMTLCQTGDLEFIKAVRKVKPISYGYLNRQSGNLFFPNFIVGMNASGGKKEAAEQFIKYFFTAEESARLSSYVCVNKGNFEKKLNVSEEEKELGWVSDTNSSEEMTDVPKLYYYELTPQEAQEFLTFLDKADTMIDVDYAILQPVMGLIEDYIFEEETLETVVDKIAKKVEIYQAE